MPRQIDHEQRRQQIGEAVCAIVAEGGVTAASLRNVAARAGVSMGAVQRCFDTAGDMIGFALDQLNHDVAARVQAAIGRARDPSARVALQAGAQEIALLGTDTDTARMWLAFHAHLSDSAVVTRLRVDEASALDAVIELIEYGQRTDEIRAGLDPTDAGRLLMATLDGIVLQRALGALDDATAQQLVARATSQLWNT